MMKMRNESGFFVFKRLFSFTAPYRFWMVLRLLCTVCKAVIDILVAYFILQLVNSAVSGNRQELLKSICFMAGFIITGIFIYYLEGYSSGKFGAYVSRDMKEKLATHISSLPVSVMENYSSGELVSRLTINVNSIEGFLKGSFLDIVFHLIRFLASFIYMFLINWELLLFCMILFPIVMLMSNAASKSLKKYWKEVNRNHAELNSIVLDSIGGIQMLKAFNLKKVMFDKYKSAVDKTLENYIAIENRNALIAPINVITEIVPYVLCFLYGGYLVSKGRLTAGGWVAFAQMLTYLIQGAGSIPGYIAQYRGTIGTAEHLFEIFDHKGERTDGEDFSLKEEVPAIEFCQVSFDYKDGSRVLQNMNFRVPHGKTVALVGPSGGGKSTILKLLCGFYELQEGCIKIYGKKLEEWNLSAARSLISLVSQETYLFPGSIMENIAFGCPGASMDDIIKAAVAANAHDFIMELPEGYATLAGERGAKLSGGQRQRISLARAILKNSPILLLDEPTAALDMESERLVQEALEKIMEGRTVFIIAHRLSTIRNADDILVIQGGRVVERGRHQQLVEKEGLYRKLYLKRFTSEISEQDDLDGKGA